MPYVPQAIRSSAVVGSLIHRGKCNCGIYGSVLASRDGDRKRKNKYPACYRLEHCQRFIYFVLTVRVSAHDEARHCAASDQCHLQNSLEHCSVPCRCAVGLMVSPSAVSLLYIALHAVRAEARSVRSLLPTVRPRPRWLVSRSGVQVLPATVIWRLEFSGRSFHAMAPGESTLR